MLAAKNHQKIQSRCLVQEFSFTDISNDISHDYKAALLKKNSLLAAKNHQKIQSRCLVQEFSFTDISNDISHDYKAALLKKNSLRLLSFYMDVSFYCYYEKVRRTMRTAVVSYLLKITESQYIALFVVSGSIKKLFSIDWVKIYFSQSIVSYLFSVDLKVWDPTSLISWFINFKYFCSFSAA